MSTIPTTNRSGMAPGLQIQEAADLLIPATLRGEKRATQDPTTGENILVDDLAYQTMSYENPEWFKQRTTGRLSDQDTVLSKNSMGTESPFQLAADKRLRKLYQRSTETALDMFGLELTPIEKYAFTEATVSDSLWDREMMDLDNGTWFLGGSQNVKIADDIPNTEAFAHNMEFYDSALSGLIGGQEQLLAVGALEYGEDSPMVSKAREGDEEALSNLRDQLRKTYYSIHEGREETFNRAVEYSSTHPDLADARRRLDDLGLLEDGGPSATAFMIREVDRVANQSAYDILNPKLSVEDRKKAMAGLTLGARVYGPDFIRNAFTGVQESGFDMDQAFVELSDDRKQMLDHLQITPQSFKDAGFDPSNRITFIYALDAAIGQQIGQQERDRELLDDYGFIGSYAVGGAQTLWRGIMDDPQARSEIIPQILTGVGGGAGLARLGMGKGAIYGAGLVQGAAEGFMFGGFASHIDQGSMLAEGTISEVSTGQIVQDALVIGGLSAGLQVGLSGLGIAASKGFGAAADGVAMASTAVARTGAVGGEAKKNALAHDAGRLLSNDDISFMRGHVYLTERDQILLQAGEAEAMDVVRRGVEMKVTGTDSVSVVNDLLSPSTLDKAGVSQIEAANFVAGVLRDLGDDETISADSLTDIWRSYLKERKARGIDGSGTREGRLADDMQFTAREDAANRVVSDAVITPANPSRIAAAKATIAKFVGGETANDVKPKELQEVVDIAVRATDLRDLDFYRQFIDTSKVRQFMGDEQADAVIARLDTIRKTTEATREANPMWVKAVELETALDRAVADGGIRVKEELGITSMELRKVVRAYARTAGNKVARQKLEASFGKARLESIIDRAHNDLDDVFRRIGKSSFSFSEFKESAGYSGVRERTAARKKFTSAVNKALRLSNAQDKDAALASAQKSFKKKMKSINKDNPNLDIDGASAEALYKTQLDMTKDFHNMSDLERAQRLADGFTRLIDRVDPEAASNAPIAKDVKQMNLLFGGTSVGGKIVAAMSSAALWPLPQSKLFRSRVRVVRGLANLIGNQHVGTRRYGQADVGTIEGAVNAARREIVPIKSQLRGLRIKLGDRGFRELQTAFQTLRMTGKMMDLRDGRLTTLPDALMKAYKNDLSAAVKDLTDLDVRYTQYFRQTLEEARNNGSMRQDPENPNLAIDPARYMPHNLNSTLTPDKQTELEDSINSFAREQLKDRASAINEDVMVSLGWIKPATARTTTEGMQVRFEVPEDSIWYGVAGGGQADVDYVLKNAKRGRAWLEEVKAARAAEQASKTRKNIGMARANPGTEAMPRPTSAARQTIANREADRVFGTDPGLKKLEKRADALRSLNIRSMSPDEQIDTIEEYGQVITAMAERQEQLALQAGEADVPPIEADLRRNMTAEDIASAASDDSTFASMSRGHAALLTRLNNMVIDGTISEESKRLVMLTYADMDLSRFVGLSMYRDSKLDNILVNYEELGRELGPEEAAARFREDELTRNITLTKKDDAGGLFHNRTESGRGGTVSISPLAREAGDDYTASTIVHELTHVVFANADPALQATLQVMYNRFFREGMDGPMAKWMRKMGMSENQIKYAGNNVHEFTSVMSETTLMKKRIKGNKSAQNFLQKLRLTFQQILDKFLIKDNPRLDKAAKTLGISDRVTELRQSIDALYGRNSEQRAVAMPDLEDVEVDTWQNRVLRNENVNKQEDQMLAILKEQEASFLGRPLDDTEERGLIELRSKISDLEESTARREWHDKTGEMSDEGKERLKELLALTKGKILDSTLDNFIRNDGIIVRTTGGLAGTANEDMESIAKNARIQWKKDQSKAGGDDRTVRMGKSEDGATMDFDRNPAIAERADDVENDVNTVEGVDSLNVRIFDMMDNADEALAKEIDKVSNMLEVVKFAHEQDMPISSHPVKGLKAELTDAEKVTRKVVEREVDGQIQEVVEEVKLGKDAQRAIVNARSLRTFNWSKMSKEQQEALVDFAAQFDIKKTQLKSSGPVLGKIKDILETEAELNKKEADLDAPSDRQAYLAERRDERLAEEERVARIPTAWENMNYFEDMDVKPEPEIELDPAEIAADNNALVQSTIAARSAGQDGQIAPEHPVTVHEIVEIAKDAETPEAVEAKLDGIVEDERNADLADAVHEIIHPEPRYDFVDVGDYDDDIREYEFENASGQAMRLDINRAKTREGDAAIEVAFYRKSDVDATPEIYEVKTRAGDARRMLTEIVERALADADEMGVNNIMFDRARGDGDSAYGKMLERGLRGNPDWHIAEIESDLGATAWTLSRGPAPEGGPVTRIINDEDAAETKRIMVALGDQVKALRQDNMNSKDADAIIEEADAFIQKLIDEDKDASSVTNVVKLLKEERDRIEDPSAYARRKQEELFEQIMADRKKEIEAANAKKQETDTDGGGSEPPKDPAPVVKSDGEDKPPKDPAPVVKSGGGDKPPKDPPPTAKGPDEDPKPGRRDAAKLTADEKKRKALIKFRTKVGGSALDRILKQGTVQPPLIPGKLNANSRHFGDDLTSAYDNAIDGVGVEEDGVAKRTRQYVNTNAMNMAEARANAADGRDVDILVNRSGERIDNTMQRRFSDADLETEDGQNIARLFAENMDLAENLDGYSRGIGSKVKIQTALNQIFGVKGMTMADLFKEGTDAIHAVLETDVNSGRRTMRKTEAERKYADEAMKQLKMMYLHTIGVPVTQFDRKSGLGRAMQIATNLVYSKLGGTFSQAVALVEAPFSILRTGGMGPTQILKNATQMLGGITQMAAGVAQRNTGPAGRMAAQFGLDAERMGYLSDDLVTYLDNFDGGGGLARFGMNDQDGGHMSAATIGDRVKANFRRVAQAGQDESEDASWLASRVEASTAALADMTGALSGMEQVTGIARSVGAGVGRESLVKHGDKLRQLAQQIDGKDVSDKELISMARSLGIPRAIASRAGSSGLLRNGGHALNILEEMLNIRYGKRGSRGNAINLTALSDSVAERHQLQRSQFLGTSAEERAAQQLDNQAIGQVQDYLMTFVKTASPELKGSLALGRGNPLAQFMFSMTSYPMAAFQHLVSNGAKFNGVAATAGTLSLLMAFEFNHRMIRTITSSRDEDRRNEALETLQKAYTGQLSMDEYATVLATYGSQSPLFGHWGKWAGEAAALAGPFAGFDVEQGFPNKPFASPVVGTFGGTVGKMTGLAREAGKEALGKSPRTRSELETRSNRLAKGMAELIDVGTPFNSGAIQVLSQAATGNKLGDAIGTAMFMGDRGFQTNGTGATPPAMLEGRSNRLWNQTVQHDQTAQAPDYKEFARDILSPSPAPPSGETVPEAKPPVISPSSPPPNASAGLADSLSKRK